MPGPHEFIVCNMTSVSGRNNIVLVNNLESFRTSRGYTSYLEIYDPQNTKSGTYIFEVKTNPTMPEDQIGLSPSARVFTNLNIGDKVRVIPLTLNY